MATKSRFSGTSPGVTKKKTARSSVKAAKGYHKPSLGILPISTVRKISRISKRVMIKPRKCIPWDVPMEDADAVCRVRR